MKTGLISGLFLFPLDRTLIISENRKCGEGLPEGQQKNTLLKKGNISSPQKKKKTLSVNTRPVSDEKRAALYISF